jgi:hypothetical protein
VKRQISSLILVLLTVSSVGAQAGDIVSFQVAHARACAKKLKKDSPFQIPRSEMEYFCRSLAGDLGVHVRLKADDAMQMIGVFADFIVHGEMTVADIVSSKIQLQMELTGFGGFDDEGATFSLDGHKGGVSFFLNHVASGDTSVLNLPEQRRRIELHCTQI